MHLSRLFGMLTERYPDTERNVVSAALRARGHQLQCKLTLCVGSGHIGQTDLWSQLSGCSGFDALDVSGRFPTLLSSLAVRVRLPAPPL